MVCIGYKDPPCSNCTTLHENLLWKLSVFPGSVLFILSRGDMAAGSNLFINKYNASDKAMDAFVSLREKWVYRGWEIWNRLNFACCSKPDFPYLHMCWFLLSVSAVVCRIFFTSIVLDSQNVKLNVTSALQMKMLKKWKDSTIFLTQTLSQSMTTFSQIIFPQVCYSRKSKYFIQEPVQGCYFSKNKIDIQRNLGIRYSFWKLCVTWAVSSESKSWTL